jgi:hypothetical protein
MRRPLVGFAVLLIVVMSVTSGRAFAVVGGKTVSIASAPWTVVVWKRSPYAGQPRYPACTGVIIDQRHILTAGHCVMERKSAKPMPASGFRIEAGVSNYKHPLASDHLQFRTVSDVRPMPGYVAESKLNGVVNIDAIGHDLAVLTLSRPLDLSGDDAQAASLPNINAHKTRLVMAGFGYESPKGGANGTLNEVTKSTMQESCSTSRNLCISATANTCWGDSGLGAVEPGSRPTVLGILSEDLSGCLPGGFDYYALLTAPAVLHFIKAAT